MLLGNLSNHLFSRKQLLCLLLLFSCVTVHGEEQKGLPSEAIREFVTVLEQIKQNYVLEQSDQTLIRNAISGMVSGLDDQSRYLDAEQLAEFERAMNGSSSSSEPTQLAIIQSNFGYLKIPAFAPRSSRAIQRALDDASGIKGLILDLRDNGGGLLEEAVTSTDLFIDKGMIVQSRGRSAAANRRFNAKSETPYAKLPIVVIINEHTASAAEVMAAALQDHKRARLIGSQTYGKGTVQSLIYTELGAIQITTSLNFRPSGDPIHDIGVKPDQEPLPNLVSKASMERSEGGWQATKGSVDKADEAYMQDHYILEAIHVLKAQLNLGTSGATPS